jgi:hypothetical protein
VTLVHKAIEKSAAASGPRKTWLKKLDPIEPAPVYMMGADERPIATRRCYPGLDQPPVNPRGAP